MNWLQNFIARLFRIEPARDRVITIREAHTFRENVIQNKLWYLGDGVTLEQYFKKTAKWDVEKARFWAATAQGNVAALLFGFFRALSNVYTGFAPLVALKLPSSLYNMLPYIISLVVLAFISRKSRAPKAEGVPYDKGQR